MKKLFFILTLLPLWGFGGLFAADPTSVTIVPITANYAANPPTVTFRLSWPDGTRNADNRSKVWVYVEYKKVLNNAYAGGWERAEIAGTPSVTSLQTATPSTVTGNTAGFYIQGPATGAFAATVTVPVSVNLAGGYSQKFAWCAYAPDRPPYAEATNGYYILHGSPPFTITTTGAGATVTESSHTYNNTCIYGLTDATGCPGDPIPFTPPEITGFIASASTICAGESFTLTATATGDAASYSFNNGYSWQASNTKVVSPPVPGFTYTLLVQPSPGACTVSASTAVIPITVHPLPEPVFVDPPAGMCPNSAATLTVDGAGSGGSYCFTYECTDCVHNPYLTGNDEQAASGCYWYSECIYSEANTYTVAMPDAGSLTVWVRAMNEYGCVDSTSITIGEAAPAITLMTGNSSQTVTQGEAMDDIRYESPCASGASVTGLPAGVTGAWNANTFTISGTPAAYGTWTYTVTTANANGFSNAAATGTITVNPAPPPNSGTYTWTCGSLTWSGMLRNAAGCAPMSTLTNSNPAPAQYYDRGATYGYYYNRTCVSGHASTLCPIPWRVPTQADFNAQVICATKHGNTLIGLWGPTGYIVKASLDYSDAGYLWTSDIYSATSTYVVLYNTIQTTYASWPNYRGLSVRCVR